MPWLIRVFCRAVRGSITSPLLRDGVKTYLPYTNTHLRVETVNCFDALGIDPIRQPLSEIDPYGYVEAFQGWWRAGETFLVVEHDITFTPADFVDILTCPASWCVFPYQIWGKMVSSGLGFTRFRDTLLARWPHLADQIATYGEIRPRQTQWWQLDQAVCRYLTIVGERPHVHTRQVAHHHAYPPIPGPVGEPRQHVLTDGGTIVAPPT